MEFELHSPLSGEDFEMALEKAFGLLERGIEEKNLDLLESAKKEYVSAQLKRPKDARAWIGAMKAIKCACVLRQSDRVEPAKVRLSLIEIARIRSSALKIVTEEDALEDLHSSYAEFCKSLNDLFPPRTTPAS